MSDEDKVIESKYQCIKHYTYIIMILLLLLQHLHLNAVMLLLLAMMLPSYFLAIILPSTLSNLLIVFKSFACSWHINAIKTVN